MTPRDVAPGDGVHGADPAHGEPLVKVDRYTAGARVNHWITAISLILLAISGLALFHPALFGLTALFGGGMNARWIHPWAGVVFAVAFLGLFLRFFWANLPELTDFVWIARLRHVLSGNDHYLPEVGKYNAGQKFVFWGMVWLVPIMFVSGIGLWEPGLAWFEQMLGWKATIEHKRLAAVVHALAAILMIVIWIVHVYAAIWVRGTLSAMIRGSVTGGWAWRHHRKWLRQEVGTPDGAKPPPRQQAAE